MTSAKPLQAVISVRATSDTSQPQSRLKQPSKGLPAQPALTQYLDKYETLPVGDRYVVGRRIAGLQSASAFDAVESHRTKATADARVRTLNAKWEQNTTEN